MTKSNTVTAKPLTSGGSVGRRSTISYEAKAGSNEKTNLTTDLPGYAPTKYIFTIITSGFRYKRFFNFIFKFRVFVFNMHVKKKKSEWKFQIVHGINIFSFSMNSNILYICCLGLRLFPSICFIFKILFFSYFVIILINSFSKCF